MENKLKEKLHQNGLLGITKSIWKPNKKSGISTDSIPESLAKSVIYEASKEYKSAMADIEIRRSEAIIEARRVNIR
jgi:hypothetical protein